MRRCLQGFFALRGCFCFSRVCADFLNGSFFFQFRRRTTPMKRRISALTQIPMSPRQKAPCPEVCLLEGAFYWHGVGGLCLIHHQNNRCVPVSPRCRAALVCAAGVALASGRVAFLLVIEHRKGTRNDGLGTGRRASLRRAITCALDPFGVAGRGTRSHGGHPCEIARAQL